MNPHETSRKICTLCSSATKDHQAEFCTSCERRMEIAFRQLGVEGSAVMVPVRVN